MIGKMIRYMRKTKGLRQIDLAKKLNIAQTTMSGYETHYSDPDFEILEKIANLCDFEIIFRNKKSKEEFYVKDIGRKDD